jgi:hypothetical protein
MALISATRGPIIVAAAIMVVGLTAPLLEAESRRPGPRVGEDACEPRIRQVDQALRNGDLNAAERAWQEAYGAALRSRRWEGLFATGDARLRIGETAKARETAIATARSLYLTALFRAHYQGSLDGVLRATQAFAALGDREVVEHGIRMAERLAERQKSSQARERVDMVRGLVAQQAAPTALNPARK